MITKSQLNTYGGYASLFTEFASIYTQYEAGQLNELIADHNATMTRYEGELIDIRVDSQIDRLREEEARLIGHNRVTASGSGFSIASKTNRDIEAGIITGIEKDAVAIRLNGDFEKMRSEFEAQGFEAQGDVEGIKSTNKILTSLSKLPTSKGVTSLLKEKTYPGYNTGNAKTPGLKLGIGGR